MHCYSISPEFPPSYNCYKGFQTTTDYSTEIGRDESSRGPSVMRPYPHPHKHIKDNHCILLPIPTISQGRPALH